MPVNYPNLIGPSTGETRPVQLQQCPEPNVASPFELGLEKDAEYRIRSIEVVDPSGVLGVRFRDAAGVNLSPGADWVPAASFTRSGPVLAQEAELVCPAGSYLTVDVTNLA